MSESSPKETDSELSTKTVRRKSRVCRLRVRVRVRDCHNGGKSLDLDDTLIATGGIANVAGYGLILFFL